MRRRPRPPRGAFVVLVGPDGVGKTTLAEHLLAGTDPPGRYFHFCPPMLGRWSSSPRPGVERPGPRSEPMDLGRTTGLVRITRRFLLFWAGYLTSVLPALRDGRDVIADRWAYGYLADPIPLRFGGTPRLALRFVKALPQPDLVVVLVAPPDIIHGRKRELTPEQIASQLESWRRIPADSVVEIDARLPPEVCAERTRMLIGGVRQTGR